MAAALICLLVIPWACQDPNRQKTYTDPGTDLRFPRELAGLRRLNIHVNKNPRLGVAVTYGLEETMTITVYTYTLGAKSVPEGVDSDEVRLQFNSIYVTLQHLRRKGTYHTVKYVEEDVAVLGKGEEAILLLQGNFRVRFEAEGTWYLSRAYMCGFRNHYLKIRCTYPESARKAGEETIDRLLKALRGMMDRVRNPREY
jgi:hypothetical protein